MWERAGFLTTRPSFLSLFTGVRGREILRTSHVIGSEKATAFSYRVQQAAEKARRRQLVEAGEFRQSISIVDAKKANTTHIDLTPRQQVYRTQDWHT